MDIHSHSNHYHTKQQSNGGKAKRMMYHFYMIAIFLVSDSILEKQLPTVHFHYQNSKFK